eukprot:TRINITY_DN10081_c0_g1_i1.p1 TRINITY_DN10081_c0_g1~~TRINITY_DN10081_c0_g1_i1.p1  ORF type:complete len:275 (+),score=29.59 TRINITY_DN10081_c0_g1_i1:46-870(+)
MLISGSSASRTISLALCALFFFVTVAKSQCTSPLSSNSTCPDANTEIISTSLELKNGSFCILRNTTVQGNLTLSAAALSFFATGNATDVLPPFAPCYMDTNNTLPGGFLTVLGNMYVEDGVQILFNMSTGGPIVNASQTLVASNASIFDKVIMFSTSLYCPVALDSSNLCDIDVLTIGTSLNFSNPNVTKAGVPVFDTTSNPGSITYVTNTQIALDLIRKPYSLTVSFTDAWTRVRFPMWAIGAISTGGILLIVLLAYAISCCRRERHVYARFN